MLQLRRSPTPPEKRGASAAASLSSKSYSNRLSSTLELMWLLSVCRIGLGDKFDFGPWRNQLWSDSLAKPFRLREASQVHWNLDC